MGSNTHQPINESDIAIIGMAARFPGAQTTQAFWNNLRNGIESMTPLSDDELREAGVPQALLDNPDYVKLAAPLEDMEGFDAGFFGFSPRDATIMDPQHRHFLECAWEALEDAGYDPSRFPGAIGVFGGSGHNAYMPYNLLSNPDFAESVGFFLLRHTGNDKDFLTTRVSYQFNLKGPSINVQTACSTSLVAVHLAAQSLLAGECNMALAGGVTIELPHRVGYLYKEGEILSPDGHCHAFDASSQGTVFGSGVGLVVLKRLEEALEDGDHVHAVIKGTAVNNDGSGKVGYLAPSVDGQVAAIAEALELSNVNPETIGYIETHGTGTPVGDPIEVAALTQAFAARTTKRQFCAIGSVKTNIGHLDTAAGVASLIKVALSLKNKQLPPSLNFEKPNPAIAFDSSPFYVNASLQDWETDGAPRRAGVSSLGVGGTNAHIVLEEAPQAAPDAPSRPWHLLTLSAKTPTALEQATSNLAAHFKAQPDTNLADAAYTLAVGRQAFAHRRIIACRATDDAAQALEDKDSNRLFSQGAPDATRSVAFMFAGGGAQYPRMGADLYRSEEVYRTEVDQCLRLLRPHLDFDLKALLYPEESAMEEAAAELERPSRALPALFVSQYAQAKLWMSWGVTPSALIGHSMGEYTAACLAGVFSLEDALAVVSTRGKLFEQVPEGGMLSVMATAESLAPLLSDDLSIAAVNAPSLLVVSGPVAALNKLEQTLTTHEIEYQRLHISVAAHSSMLEPILAPFANFLKDIKLQPPQMPFISNLSGDWITAAEATDPNYWVKHLRHTIQFADGVAKLLQDGTYALLEVGPGRTLATFAKLHPDKAPEQLALTSLRHPKETMSDLAFMLTTLGRLWLGGVEVDWQALYDGERRQRIPLPTYPFEHKRYWLEPGKQAAQTTGIPRATGLKKQPLDNWFYTPSWQRTLPPSSEVLRSPALSTYGVLVFADESELSTRLLERLEGAGCRVITVRAGSSFAATGANSFTINPATAEDYQKLFESLQGRAEPLTHIWHLWNLQNSVTNDARLIKLDEVLGRGFYSLLYIAQATANLNLTAGIKLDVLSDGMQGLAGQALTAPLKATLLGPCRVINREFPMLHCRSLDIALPNSEGQLSALVEHLARDLLAPSSAETAETVIAYRGDERFTESFDKLALASGEAPRLRQQGVYLITGGLGGIGATIARYLVETKGAKVALLSRSPLPPKDTWDGWLAAHPKGDKISHHITTVRNLEANGGEVLVLNADVGELESMRAALAQVQQHFGALHGVFHAAGVLDDGLIQLKTKSAADAVLYPKLRGALVLDTLLQDTPLDFMLLFSSISSLAGIEGQIDYTAANAFLDAYARHKRAKDGTPVTAVNWSRWQDVGMMAGQADEAADAEQLMTNPLFERRRQHGSEVDEYSVLLSTDSHWLLDEHRTKKGTSLMPGTGYLEFVRNAFAASAGSKAVEIRDVFFSVPLVFSDGEPKEFCVRLEHHGAAADFSILSHQPLGPGEETGQEEHVSGSVRQLDQEPHTLALKEILNRCQTREELFTGIAPHEHLNFGPRWACVEQINFGQQEAVVSLRLPAEFAADLDSYPLHPALLDMATGAAQALIPNFDPVNDFLVPISYSSIRSYDALQPTLYSHVRLRTIEANEQTAVFDITITDKEGKVLVDIEQFVMKRVAHDVLDSVKTQTSAKQTASGAIQADSSGIADDVQTGILAHEGTEVLERLLAGAYSPQVIVSPIDFHSYLASLERPSTEPEVEESHTASTGQDRPTLSTDYLAPTTELETSIVAIWQQALGVNSIGLNDDFFELGGHSLLLTQVLSSVRKKHQLSLPLSKVFGIPTVAQWVQEIDAASAKAASEPEKILAEQGLVTGPVPLTPSLQRFLDRGSANPHQWNLSLLLASREPLNAQLLEQVMQHLIAHHDSLRLRFSLGEAGWQAVNGGLDEKLPFSSMDLSRLSSEDQQTTIRRVSVELQTSLHLSQGPLLRVVHFDLGDRPHQLLGVVNHCVADALSWNIFWDDFETAYKQLLRGETIHLPAKTTSFKQWAELLSELAQSTSLKQALDDWLAAPWLQAKPLPMDHDGINNNASARTHTAFLSVSETRELLGALGSDYRVEDMLIAALVQTLAPWSGSSALRLDVMAQGREESLVKENVDLSRTLGFFANYIPLVLESEAFRPRNVLATISQQIQRLSARGSSFDVLQYLSEDAEVIQKLRPLPKAEILFNYIGRRDENDLALTGESIFQATEDTGRVTEGITHDPAGLRYYPLAIQGRFPKGRQLGLKFVYSENLHRQATIERLAREVLATLRSFIDSETSIPTSPV